MWIARVADSKLKFGEKAVLMMLAMEFDAYGTPLYANKGELVAKMTARCPDLKAGYIDKALAAGIAAQLVVREYHHSDGYTVAIYRPWESYQKPHGPDVYVASEDTTTWTGALEVAEGRERAEAL
jgi:hypothetical protein